MKNLKHLIIMLGCASTLAFADTDRKELRLADCPAEVQATVTANARGGVVDEVEVITIEGKNLYVADVDLPGRIDLKIYISGAGKLVKTREDLHLKDLPEAVRNALQALGGKIDEVDKEVADGKVTYFADLDRAGQPDLDVVLAPDGTVIRKTEDLD
jgi:hypothetical protein